MVERSQRLGFRFCTASIFFTDERTSLFHSTFEMSRWFSFFVSRFLMAFSIVGLLTALVTWIHHAFVAMEKYNRFIGNISTTQFQWWFFPIYFEFATCADEKRARQIVQQQDALEEMKNRRWEKRNLFSTLMTFDGSDRHFFSILLLTKYSIFLAEFVCAGVLNESKLWWIVCDLKIFDSRITLLIIYCFSV